MREIWAWMVEILVDLAFQPTPALFRLTNGLYRCNQSSWANWSPNLEKWPLNNKEILGTIKICQHQILKKIWPIQRRKSQRNKLDKLWPSSTTSSIWSSKAWRILTQKEKRMLKIRRNAKDVSNICKV